MQRRKECERRSKSGAEQGNLPGAENSYGKGCVEEKIFHAHRSQLSGNGRYFVCTLHVCLTFKSEFLMPFSTFN